MYIKVYVDFRNFRKIIEFKYKITYEQFTFGQNYKETSFKSVNQ